MMKNDINEDFYCFEFRKGGILIFNEWVPPSKWKEETGEYLDEGFYREIDCTKDLKWMHKRDLSVRLDPDFTVNDLFLFVSESVGFWDMIAMNCFVQEYVDKWKEMKDTYTRIQDGSIADDLEYVELYWAPELDFDRHGFTEISWNDRMNLHGASFIKEEDYYEGEGEHRWLYCKKGNRIHYGIDFCELKDLLKLPIKVNEAYQIYDDWNKYKHLIKDGKKYNEVVPLLLDARKKPTLEQIVVGVFWELSFYGCEEEKLEKKEELDERVAEFKSLTEKEL